MQINIQKARITKVEVKLDESQSQYLTNLTISTGELSWYLVCDLSDPISNQRLSRLMSFTGAKFFEELQNAEIRVLFAGISLLAFGSIEKDLFVPLVKNLFVEKSEQAIRKAFLNV